MRRKNRSIKTVNTPHGTSGSLPLRQLRNALSYYGERSGLRWDFRISEIKGRHVAWNDPSKPPLTVLLELSPRDALALATVLTAAADPGQGRKPVGRVVPVM